METYTVNLTLDEIKALLATSGNVDSFSLEEEMSEEEQEKWVDDFDSAIAKLREIIQP